MYAAEYPASAVLRTSPPPQGARPVRHRRPVGRPRPRQGASRVACAFLVYMLPPLPRHSDWRHCFAQSIRSYQTSPPRPAGRPVHFTFRGLLSVHSRCGLHTRAATVCRGTLTRRLQPFRYLHSCSGCFRLERLPGGACTRWKAPPLHGARRDREYALGGRPTGHRCTAARRVRRVDDSSGSYPGGRRRGLPAPKRSSTSSTLMMP